MVVVVAVLRGLLDGRPSSLIPRERPPRPSGPHTVSGMTATRATSLVGPRRAVAMRERRLAFQIKVALQDMLAVGDVSCFSDYATNPDPHCVYLKAPQSLKGPILRALRDYTHVKVNSTMRHDCDALKEWSNMKAATPNAAAVWQSEGVPPAGGEGEGAQQDEGKLRDAAGVR